MANLTNEVNGTGDLIQCNDTSPVCALSDLRCDSRYSVVVIPC